MVNKIDLLSDGEFKKLIENSCSTSDVLRQLGYSTKGNSWGYKIIADRMDKLNVFFGKKHTQNNNKVTKLPLEKVLTEDSQYNRTNLKDRLVIEGLKEYKCECCGITEWNNKPISLQLHHLNGINNDNRLENLQLLCPNCHSQTENFGTKGKGRVVKKMANNLPLEDKKKIMECVREFGIVEARKRLTYRNSLINSVVKLNHDKIVMITPEGKEMEFTTTYDAAKYIYSNYGIGKNELSSRTGISKCCNGKQESVHGFKFYRRSAEL